MPILFAVCTPAKRFTLPSEIKIVKIFRGGTTDGQCLLLFLLLLLSNQFMFVQRFGFNLKIVIDFFLFDNKEKMSQMSNYMKSVYFFFLLSTKIMSKKTSSKFFFVDSFKTEF